jgi:UDP-3-O-[3-hydroxymyristoyl] glucosamine N-acyltransferase
VREGARAMPPGPFRLAEIAGRLGGEVVGAPETEIRRVASLRSAGPGDLSFLADARHRADLAATRADAVIVSEGERDATGLPRIVCGDPYAYFARVAQLFNPPPAVEPGVHPAAAVSPAATVAASASIAAGCVVERDARIGERVALGAGCYVGAGASIGADSRLHPRVVVYGGCTVGQRAIVHSGAVIGADGFGFAPEGGRWLKIPQTGRVVIGDDVEIGANTSIDRGAVDDTVIEDGVKLDNQIQIGHNCRIGAHTAVAGCVGIAGSTTVGRNCMIGGAAMIGGHLAIPDGSVIAGATVVTRSLDRAGAWSSVIPATEVREWRRTVALLRGLARLAERLRALERRSAGTER